MTALMEFTSHVAGKNARVSVYPDRLEWVRGGLSMKKLTTAAVTLGASALVTGVSNKGVEMIPMRAITGVSSKKGMLNTMVSVSSPSGVVEMKCSHAEADEVKAMLLRLMAG